MKDLFVSSPFLPTKKTMKDLFVSSVKKVGEVLVSSFIQTLCDQLLVPEFLDFVRGAGLQENLDKWSETLSTIQTMLDDAEERQHTDKAVKEWLDDLRDLAYDMDDIVDELSTEASTAAENQARPSKVAKLTSATSWVTPFTPSYFEINGKLRSKMNEVTDRINDIVTRKGQLNLNETAPYGRSYRIERAPAPTSVMVDSHVYGREKDKEVVLELLLNEKYCSDTEVSVIPILGMGGIGKTTLAQLLFNDEKVKSIFDLKAWACVSEDFDVDRVTKTILQSFTSEDCDGKDRNWLQVKLKEKLEGKKFLVVLDDLWNEKYNDWTILRAPFLAGAPGSTIVITTRNQRVSSIVGTNIPAYRMQVLSNDACLSVFTQHALGSSNFNAHPELQDIGEKIVERCKGLPLAARTLGGLLRTTLDRDEWKDVLNSKIWDIPESGILPALMLSYHHLPSHLKRCFMYCSILPKDYEFEEQQLVLLWMAEGLIQPREGDKQIEVLGSKYFRDLLSRSFFQQSSTEKPRFVMHDLINDLAERVAGDTCFKMEDQIGGSNGRRLPKKVRHSSYLGGKYDITKKFEPFFELTCLRTFLPLPRPSGSYLTHNVPLKLLPELLCLRAVSLSGYNIVELPDSIGDLKHLRYLDLSYTRIRGLPESTTTLCNLQTMILERCSYLKTLPSKIGNLVNLRHLNIFNANKLEGMPPQMGKLTSLQTLSNLIVGKDNCFALKELGSLLHLQGTLIISRLENAIEPRDARDVKVIEKLDLITALCLEWSVNVDDSQDRRSELDVLDMLQPHNALNELTIRCYGGTIFPTWLKSHSFPHMVLLRIENCEKCTSLPPVGQLPSLKQLFIEGMASVKNVGIEFYGEGSSEPFRLLETLQFNDMEEWENWSPNGEFPHLRDLSIENCPKLLGKLPNHFPSLGKVWISGCQRLVVSISSFPELCKLEIEGSKGMVCQNKVDFSSINLKSLSTISEFMSPIEGLLLEGLTQVKDLTFRNCEGLTSLWSNDVGLQQPLPHLRVLTFYNCPKLVSLVAEEVNEQSQLDLPSTLREIHISNCDALKSLPKSVMYNNTCIEYIDIYRCNSLKHIAIRQLPPTLKRLEIRGCGNMLILLDEDGTNSTCCSSASLLEYLNIYSCPSLKSLIPSGELPATLKCLGIKFCSKLESIAKSFHPNSCLETIDIWNCENLESLPMGIHTLNHLDTIKIRGCPTLVSFPNRGLLPHNLRKLRIGNIALPNCIHSLTSLQKLGIRSGTSLVSFPKSVVSSFPEEGFPTTLTSLDLWDYNITKALLDWGLHRLSSLQKLKITDDFPHLESFPEKMLPASLTTLIIEGFRNLKYLSSLRNLTSLEELCIKECKNLTSFPEDGLPPSLQLLDIGNCKNLTSFPEDGLPPSLQQLYITNCPRLKERCKKDKGQEWSKIAHIPRVEIDGRFIYDPEE